MGLPKHIVDAANGRSRTAEDLEVVRVWIEQTQNINATYTLKRPWGASTGRTLLYCLTLGTTTPAALDLIRLLIARGADVNMRDSDGKSPLHNACRGTSPTLVSLLLDAGAADLNTQNGDDMKPLALAIFLSKDPLEISRILLRAGASLDRVICAGGNSRGIQGPGALLGEMSAEQFLACLESNKPDLTGDEHWRALKNLVHGTRTRRAIARLRSYAIRGRVTAEVRLLDDGALAALVARVKLYNSLFGLPHDLFKEIVSKL